MRHLRPTKILLLALALSFALSGLASAVAGQAAAEEELDLGAIAADRAQKQSKHKLGRRVGRYLSRAADAVDEGNPDEAEALLLRLNPNRLNPLQRAYIYRLLAVIAYGNEQPDKAIGYFEQVLEQETLPIRDENKIRFTIAQLQAQRENWPGVITWLHEWRRYETNPDPLGFYLLGLAHFQLKEYDTAIEKVKLAVDMSPEPRESWLRMLYALHTEKEDFVTATPILEDLLVRFPKKAYWVQLSLIYGARENYPRSLAVQQVAYSQGYLDEDKELQRLARTFLFNDLPHPAARVMEAGLESGQIEPKPEAYELLANSWIAAREFDRALGPLETAAELSEGGRLYARLGQVHLQREQWDQAAAMFEKALEKGSLEKQGRVELLLGIAHYNGNRPRDARRYFVRAREHEQTREEANRWITHIATEASQSG